jgi:hypothetical protein
MAVLAELYLKVSYAPQNRKFSDLRRCKGIKEFRSFHSGKT